MQIFEELEKKASLRLLQVSSFSFLLFSFLCWHLRDFLFFSRVEERVKGMCLRCDCFPCGRKSWPCWAWSGRCCVGGRCRAGLFPGPCWKSALCCCSCSLVCERIGRCLRAAWRPCLICSSVSRRHLLIERDHSFWRSASGFPRAPKIFSQQSFIF